MEDQQNRSAQDREAQRLIDECLATPERCKILQQLMRNCDEEVLRSWDIFLATATSQPSRHSRLLPGRVRHEPRLPILRPSTTPVTRSRCGARRGVRILVPRGLRGGTLRECMVRALRVIQDRARRRRRCQDPQLAYTPRRRGLRPDISNRALRPSMLHTRTIQVGPLPRRRSRRSGIRVRTPTPLRNFPKKGRVESLQPLVWPCHRPQDLHQAVAPNPSDGAPIPS
jgi:hypothetical protein